jgi:peptidoglycan hydrolase-like protein with peptidoglycan-binding domain
MKIHPLIRHFILLSGFLTAVLPLSAAPPVVKTVPWVGSQPLIPHDTWSGKAITLKGTSDVQGANIQYTWDFGDGSPAETGTVTNQYVIEETHTYTESTGTVFTATLTVRNTTTGETSSKQYYVKIEDKSLPVEVNVAIDEGLWYLWKTPTRLGGGQYRWSNIHSGSSYSNYYGNSTASAVQAFQVHGHREGQADNPYSEAVRGGIDYLMTGLYAQGMSLQGGENPESSSPPNASGLSWNSARPIYESGAVMDAFVSSGTPDATARTGNASVIGRTYKEIVQDMVDMYAWGQVDSGSARGGWQYSWNSGSDNSAAQWGAIGMIAAERNFGCTVPAWVKSRNREWLNYSYNAGGWFGYEGPSAVREVSTGPCGMVQLSFTGLDSTGLNTPPDPNYPKWVKCIEYLRTNWTYFINAGRDARYYSYYAFTKAMRTALPSPVVNLPAVGTLPELDWYGDNTQGLARILVNRQTSNGSWAYDGWPYVGEQTTAAWNVIILSPTLFEAGSPVAVAKAIPNPAVAGQTVQLDGSASFHQDPTKLIDSWQWDLDNNGSFEASGPFPTVSFPALGDYPVKLRVTDNAAQEAAAETILTIRVTIPPLAPTAVAGGPYSFCPATKPWYLDGTGSINPDEGQSEPGRPGDTIVSYAWDLDGDGQFDDATGAQPNITAFFDGISPGSYLIQLKVTDRTATSFPSSQSGDLSDTDSAIVVVRNSTDPDCGCVKDLVARAKPGKVQLVWTDYPGAHHYNVYRSTVSGGPYVKIASPITTYSTYLDAIVVNGTTYYYVVRPATFLDQERCQSNQASAKPVATR